MAFYLSYICHQCYIMWHQNPNCGLLLLWFEYEQDNLHGRKVENILWL